MSDGNTPLCLGRERLLEIVLKRQYKHAAEIEVLCLPYSRESHHSLNFGGNFCISNDSSSTQSDVCVPPILSQLHCRNVINNIAVKPPENDRLYSHIGSDTVLGNWQAKIHLMSTTTVDSLH